MSYTTARQDFTLGAVCIALLTAFTALRLIIFTGIGYLEVRHFTLVLVILVTALLFTLFMSSKASLVVQVFTFVLILLLDIGPWYADLVIALVIASGSIGLDIVKRRINKLLAERDARQAEIQKAMESLQKVDQLKDEIIFIASHDLRTPLSIIKANLGSIREGYAGKVNKQASIYVDAAYRASERLGDLLEDLLEASVHEHTHEVKLEAVQIEEVIAEIVKLHNAGGVTVRFPKRPYKASKAFVDKALLRRALENLFSNSVKYTKKGSIVFSVEDAEDRVRCVIADTGIGISEDAIDRMFTKFYRAPNAVNANTRGTGLGLYITKQLIQKLRGTITVHSKLNEGSRFIIELPKVRS